MEESSRFSRSHLNSPVLVGYTRDQRSSDLFVPKSAVLYLNMSRSGRIRRGRGHYANIWRTSLVLRHPRLTKILPDLTQTGNSADRG